MLKLDEPIVSNETKSRKEIEHRRSINLLKAGTQQTRCPRCRTLISLKWDVNLIWKSLWFLVQDCIEVVRMLKKCLKKLEKLQIKRIVD